MTTTISNSDRARLSRDLRSLNAKPVWERTTRMGPGSSALPAIWHYRELRPQLLRAISVITAKEAERRVLMLENPGLPETGFITNSLFCGLQVIAPGEIAPAHRHAQNALRFIIEGEGAYTTVEGERVIMQPGDLVLTPGWSWHDHGHLGSAPAIWLDALDTAFGQFFGALFRDDFPDDAQPVSKPEGNAAAHYGSNLLPIECRPGSRSSPLLLYPYDRTRDVLDRLARNSPPHPAHGIKMRYGNPIDRGYVYPTIAAFIQWLPKGFSGQTYRSTDGAVFHAVEGSGRVHIGGSEFLFVARDVFVVPPWTAHHFTSDSECVLFSYSDRAAQQTLGFWREDDPSNPVGY